MRRSAKVDEGKRQSWWGGAPKLVGRSAKVGSLEHVNLDQSFYSLFSLHVFEVASSDSNQRQVRTYNNPFTGKGLY